MTDTPIIDTQVLREQAAESLRCRRRPRRDLPLPHGTIARRRLGYDPAIVDTLPDRAVESFAGVANPFSLRTISGQRTGRRRRVRRRVRQLRRRPPRRPRRRVVGST